ncbi:fimbrial protein, partial [Providencia stuartii]
MLVIDSIFLFLFFIIRRLIMFKKTLCALSLISV